MGAKNCPETPRQRMIAMMYLVLTAMLALNVSKDILQAFTVVNDSIVETNRIFKAKVDGNYKTFEQAYAISPGKVKENYDKALEVKKEADILVAFIEQIKWEIIGAVEGKTADEVKAMEEAALKEGKSFLQGIDGKDNFDIPHRYLFGDSDKGESGTKVGELKDKIVAFKKKMTDILGPKYAQNVNLGLDVEKDFPTVSGEGTANWQVTNFYHTILAADVVILNKTILEVRNAEADVVSQLYAMIDAEGFSFDKVGAKVIAKSNYVLVGSEYEAEIFVAAYDSKQQPVIKVGSAVDSTTLEISGNVQTIEGKDGVGIYKVGTGSIGEQKFGGVIEITSRNGVKTSYPFNSSYFVAQPSATVSADKMNVFYIGVDNPVTISVPGVANERVRASISNGSLSPTGGGHYIVKVSGGSESVINVSAEIDGGSRAMGQATFRVKPIPTPIPKVANKISGNFTKAEILASPYVLAVLENFDFDLRYNVVSYKFTYKNAAGDLIDIGGQGYILNEQMKNLIQNSRRGDRFWIEDIIAAGPTGSRQIGSVTIRITQ
jgi:gliding motility-associated protein GldM